MLDRPFSKLAAVAFALGAGAGACTATLDFTECRVDADCSKFFEDDKPMRCEDFQCVVRDRCDGNSQCAGLGEGYVCTVVGTCIQVESDLCSAPVYPEAEEMAGDEVLLIGSIVAKDGPDAALGEAVEAAIRLAIADFNAITKLQNGKAIALVPCDSQGDKSKARAAATHLGDALAVPAILGPLSDGELYDVAYNVSIVNGIRAFTHSPTAAAELDFPDMNLVWQTQVATQYQGRAIGEHIAFETAEGTFDAEPTTVMLFAQSGSYGYALYHAIATEETPGEINRIPEAGAQKISSYSTAADGMAKLDEYVDANTEVLVLAGGSEVGEMLSHLVETDTVPTRVYIGPPSRASVQMRGDVGLAGSLRLIGPDLMGPTAQGIRDRLGDSAATPEVALAYDATMTTLLAMTAIPSDSAITGPNIAKNMARLNEADGLAISFGDPPEAFIKDAVDQLAGGKDLQVTGASGQLEYLDDGTMCGDLAAFTFDGAAFTVGQRFATSCPEATGTWSAG